MRQRGGHGDLLDVIRESCGLADFRGVAIEARRFLGLPRSEPEPERRFSRVPAPSGSTQSARRLFAMSRPIAGTPLETYLRKRGIANLRGAKTSSFPSALLLPAGR